MICEKCKNILPDDSEFCQFCGNRTKLSISAPIAESNPAPESTLPDEDIVEKMIAAGTQNQIFDNASKPSSKKERSPKAKKVSIVLLAIVLALAVLGVGGYSLVSYVILPAQAYSSAEELYAKGDYAAAEAAFMELGDYSDAAEKVLQCQDAQAIFFIDNANFNDLTTHIRVYGLSGPVQEHISNKTLGAIEQEDYNTACLLITALSQAPDAQNIAKEALYQKALTHYNAGEYITSNDLFEYLGSYKDSKQKIHEHSFTVKSETAATCDKDGATIYECSCGATESKPIKATGHDYSDATCKAPATCKVCGKSNGATLNHNFSAATCTKAKTCSVCGATEGSPSGHSLVDCVCSNCGVVKITLDQLQGTWKATTYSEWFGAGTTTIVISGNVGIYYHVSEKGSSSSFSGPIQLKDYGFYFEGTHQGVDMNGNPYEVGTSWRCYITKFTPDYFVDTFIDDGAPCKWYKQ